jgi:LPXTG-motif cell wall-anchored protein
MENILKWIGGLGGLCLLCCALPLTLAFASGGALAVSSMLFGDEGIIGEVILLSGVTLMALAAWLILRRKRRLAASCNIKSA